MRIIAFILTLSICFLGLKAQDLHFTPKISTGPVFLSTTGNLYSQKDINEKIGIAIQSSINIRYYLVDNTSIGVEPSSLYIQRKFETPYPRTIIPERSYKKQYTVSSFGFLLPLEFRYTLNSFFFTGQYGLMYFFYSKNRIALTIHYMNEPEKSSIISLHEDEVRLKSKNSPFGQFLSVGLGKTFHINKTKLTSEIKYLGGITPWIFQPTTNNSSIKFTSHTILLSVGLELFNSNK